MATLSDSDVDWPLLALVVTLLTVGELSVAGIRLGRYRQRLGLYEATLVVGLALASGPWLVPAAAVAAVLARSATWFARAPSTYLDGRRPPKNRWRRHDRRQRTVRPPNPGRRRWWQPDARTFGAALAASSVGLAVFVTDAVLAAGSTPDRPTASAATTATATTVAAVAAGALAGGGLRSLVLVGVGASRREQNSGGGKPTDSSPLLAAVRLQALALAGNTCLGVAVVVLAAYSPPTLLLTPAVAAALVVAYRTRSLAAEERRSWQLVDRICDDLAGLAEPALVDVLRLRTRQLFQAESVDFGLGPVHGVPAHGVPAHGLPAHGLPAHGGTIHPNPGERTTVPGFTRRTRVVEAPMRWSNEVLGQLSVAFDQPTPWRPTDEMRLRAVARSAAALVAHARLRQRGSEAAAVAEYAAEHDALTGLGNRRLLVSRAADLLDSSPDGCLALLLLDLDRFKEVNDTLGHATGDQLLRAVADALRRGVRQGDVVARVGGDEFAVLVTGIAGPVQAEAVAAELADLLCRPVEVDGTGLAVEVSVGVACHPHDGRSVDELMQHADIAMYQAKQSHPRWRRYVPDDRSARLERLELVGELRGAISGGELVLNYQPQLELRSGQVKAVEALVRWNHPRRGLITPTTFVPAVEQSGLIQPFTFAVLDQALQACAGWRAAGFDVAVSVNLSARNLMNTELPGEVAKLLVMRGVPASSLTLEITETARMVDVASALRLLRELHELGVRVAADDFGTGYSSMALIQERVLDEVKIDRSFVRRLLVEQGDAAIVAATVQLAHAHGLTVVAEGVENAELLDALAGLHCDQVQGLHVGPAMPLAELTSWLGGAARAPRRAVGDTVRIFPGPHRRSPDSGRP